MSKDGQWWDKSWNPVEGCSPISEACENCWAMSMLKNFRGMRPGEFKFYYDRLALPAKWIKPRRIFVGSLTDMFHEKVLDTTCEILRGISAGKFPRQHTYIFCTKRPQSALRISHVFHGMRSLCLLVTCENQHRFDERWGSLAEIQVHPPIMRGLFLEPLLGPIDLTPALPHVQWVIVGGENGPKARPMHPNWVRSIRDQCVAAGVSFWFKSWGTNDDDVTEFGQNDGWPRTLDGRTWEERP